MNIKDVVALATRAHGDQRYGDGPYMDHIQQVVGVLSLYFQNVAETTIHAAVLHDTLEDTDLSPDEILNLCGPEVLRLVQLVTDKPGKNRKARHEATYPLIAQDLEATKIKIADRIANVCASDEKRLPMYKKEWPYFLSIFGSCEDSEVQAALEYLRGILG